MSRFRLLVALLLLITFSFGRAESDDSVLLRSREHVVGPLGGQESTEELVVQSDGAYTYSVTRTSFFGNQEDRGKPKRREFSGKLSADELDGLRRFLDSSPVQKLPSKTEQLSTIDFVWDIDLEVSSVGRRRAIEVRTFQPWADPEFHVYPRALVELACKADTIKQMAEKTTSQPDSDWCTHLLGPSARVLSTPTEPATTK